jgi:hypothetical protein
MWDELQLFFCSPYFGGLFGEIFVVTKQQFVIQDFPYDSLTKDLVFELTLID